jgi:Tol biopolymer transport system component/DNA-binding winged helix-turn-helix (wHTH) protein
MDVSPSPPRPVRFGVFELDLRSGELRKAGARLKLSDQPFQILAALLERPGQLVTRDELRQRLWPADTFVDFEHGLNAAVKRLRETLGDTADAPRFIETVPRRGYRFIAPLAPAGEQAHQEGSPPLGVDPARASAPIPRPVGRSGPRSPWRLRVSLGAAGILLLAAAAAWQVRPPARPGQPAMRVVPLTALSGFENGPAFSPDGRQLAFAWNGEQQNGFDIYIKLVGSSDVRRLTTDPAVDLAPQWSPDGLKIAYTRAEPSFASQRVRVMSSLGGSDRQVSDFPVWLPATWSPDGRYVVAGGAMPPGASHASNGIYLIPLQAGEPRAITRPQPHQADHGARFSPDGRRLAYARCNALRTDCHLEVLDLDGSFAGIRPARRLTPLPITPRAPLAGLRSFMFRPPRSISWTPDGTFVLFSAEEATVSYLWRVAADGKSPPERIEMAGANATFLAVSPDGERLAFSRLVLDDDIYRVEQGRAAQPVAQSSVYEGNVQFSPDGRRIAFCSSRSGDTVEVWVADADGANPQQLTEGPGPWQCSPTWSPDGRQIAFDSRAADRRWHVWSVDVQGGGLQQITNQPGDQNMPTWSRDGEWIYFSWQQGEERNIWRTRRRTGATERVTRGGSGVVGRESADGQVLLYQPAIAATSPVLGQPLDGGSPRTVIPCIAGSAMAVGRAGIYYVGCPRTPGAPDLQIRLLDAATGQDREIGELESFATGQYPSTFAVSPDGRAFLFGRLASSTSDLMMLEHFR